MEKTVAVIIPYYNGSKFIDRALKSVLNQSVKANEIIVIDDGSTEADARYLDSIAEEYGAKVFHKTNGGQGSARNYGVEKSASNFISFLDQDDYYLQHHISILIDAIPIDDSSFGCVYADLYEGNAAGEIVRQGMVKQHARHPKSDIFDMLRNDMFILPSASLISKKSFLKINGFDPQFTGYEDDDFFLRLFRAGFSNIYIDKCVTVWCIHIESTSYSIKMSRSRFKYLKKMSDLFPDEKIAKRFYFRDLLIPRFNNIIITDAIKHKANKSKDSAEAVNILIEYANLVSNSESVNLRFKFKTWLISRLVAITPELLLNNAISIAKIKPFGRLIGRTLM